MVCHLLPFPMAVREQDSALQSPSAFPFWLSPARLRSLCSQAAATALKAMSWAAEKNAHGLEFAGKELAPKPEPMSTIPELCPRIF